MKTNTKKVTKRNEMKQQISRNVIVIILYIILLAIDYWIDNGAKNPWDCIMKKASFKDSNK